MKVVLNSLDYTYKAVNLLPISQLSTTLDLSFIHRDVKILSRILNISNINLSITISGSIWSPVAGVVLHPDELPIHKDYYHLVLNPRMFYSRDQNSYLLTLSHEMVHIQQYISKALTVEFSDFDNKEKVVKFKNTLYSFETIQFIRDRGLEAKLLPWEKEAYSLERPLATQLCNELQSAYNNFR